MTNTEIKHRWDYRLIQQKNVLTVNAVAYNEDGTPHSYDEPILYVFPAGLVPAEPAPDGVSTDAVMVDLIGKLEAALCFPVIPMPGVTKRLPMPLVNRTPITPMPAFLKGVLT